MEINYVKIGKRIETARIKKGMTQEQLAKIVTLSPAYLDRVEHGNTDAKIPGLLRIANALNTTLDDFFCDCYRVNSDRETEELKKLLEGCSEYERIAILEFAKAMKAVLQNKPKD